MTRPGRDATARAGAVSEIPRRKAMQRAIYKPLPMTKMAPGITVQAPGAYAPKPIRADSPAIEAMTDFRHVAAATIRASATIREATHVMIARGVRLLIVIDVDRVV